MSGFVPFRPGAEFEARLLERSRTDVPETAEPISDASPTQAPVSDEGPGATEADDPVGLPQTLEELQALIASVQIEARASAEADLSGLKSEIEAERTALTCLIDGLDRARQTWAKEVREQLGEVLLVGVRQIVSESATLQSEALKQRIAEVGERLIGEQQVVLRVPESEVEFARSLVADREGWQVLGDDSLVKGGCVAETDGGQIDATLGAAFSGLSGSVKEWIDSAEDGEE